MIDLDQEWFDVRLNQEIEKLQKVLPLDEKNKYSVHYWKGFLKGADDLCKSDNPDTDADLKTAGDNKVEKLDKTSLEYYYWSGYLRGLEILRKLYKEWQTFKKYAKD